jgi:hypothetical protein
MQHQEVQGGFMNMVYIYKPLIKEHCDATLGMYVGIYIICNY